jgi:ribosome-associated protein
MLVVAPDIRIDESEIEEKFVRASGPGGQNVNKVATSVQLRFDVSHSPSLPEAVRQRLLQIAAGRVSAEGILIIEARQFRTQEQNRQAARERLVALLQKAAEVPRVRRPSRPSLAAKAARTDNKRRRGRIKRLRHTVPPGDD